MKRNYSIDNTEPEESNFKIPSEKEHLLQVIDVNPLRLPDGTEDDNIQIVKLEVVGGEEEGVSLLNRIRLDQSEKAFYFTRLFLKAIGEPYKGEFELDIDHWIGRQFYATVKHTKVKDKTYANIDQYNFDKKVEQVFHVKNPDNVTKPEEIQW